MVLYENALVLRKCTLKCLGVNVCNVVSNVSAKIKKDKANAAKWEELMNQGEGFTGTHCTIHALFLKFLKFSKQKVGRERDFSL